MPVEEAPLMMALLAMVVVVVVFAAGGDYRQWQVVILVWVDHWN
jgi:hypothetical protein